MGVKLPASLVSASSKGCVQRWHTTFCAHAQLCCCCCCCCFNCFIEQQFDQLLNKRDRAYAWLGCAQRQPGSPSGALRSCLQPLTIIIIVKTLSQPGGIRYGRRKSTPSRQACFEHHGCSGLATPATEVMNWYLLSARAVLIQGMQVATCALGSSRLGLKMGCHKLTVMPCAHDCVSLFMGVALPYDKHAGHAVFAHAGNFMQGMSYSTPATDRWQRQCWFSDGRHTRGMQCSHEGRVSRGVDRVIPFGQVFTLASCRHNHTTQV